MLNSEPALKQGPMSSIVFLILAMLLAPLYAGLIIKVKAFFGGRKGSPLLIHYYTLAKLLKKGSVYSTSTTAVFKLGPMVSLCAAATGLLFLPVAGAPPLFSFTGDVILVLYLFGLGRFFTIAAAMDTASPFEGMGAAREAYFPIICEATLFVVLILFYTLCGELNLAAYFAGDRPMALWQTAGAPLLFVVIALFIVLLTENSRVPVDDPTTHLELTMIHEVMVLDHSGPDFAFIELGAFFKLFFYSTLVARLICPLTFHHPAADAVLFLGVLGAVYVAVGVTESVMARYRMDKVPQFVLTSFALAFFATVITLEFLK
jgi:formate hydrogenlyase subunit 4